LVLDLTLKPNCLVCGAYEALAAHRPMVLSDNPATVDLFGKVAVFPRTAAAEDIAAALVDARQRFAELRLQVCEAHPQFLARWTALAEGVQQRIRQWSTSTRHAS